jgi:hypothetical protein
MRRFVAAVVMLIVAGLPVAGAICARQCVPHTDEALQASSANGAAHCHDVDAVAARGIRSVVPEACAPAVGTAALTAERTSPPATATALYTRSVAPPIALPQRAQFRVPGSGVGAPPGVQLQLRI